MRNLNQAIEQIKLFKTFMNDEAINIMITYVSGLFDVDTETIIKIMNRE